MSMRRKALLLIAAAAAVAAIVVLTTGAFAGTTNRSDQSDGGTGDFLSCLASQGVQVPTDDPTGVKQWLADDQDDPAVQAGLEACRPQDGTHAGPTPDALVTCLEQHGVDVPSDVKENADGLKPWLAEAMKQSTVSAALDACTESSSGGQKK
jgi:hypothetical protein